MSARHAARASTDPRAISPKVKAAGEWGAVLTVLAVLAAVFIESMPTELLAGLGPWGVPVGATLATLAALLGAWARRDPAREPSLLLDASGHVYTSADDVEAERFIKGEYASNAQAVTPGVVLLSEGQEVAHVRPEVESPVVEGEVVDVELVGVEELAQELAQQDARG